MSYHAPDRGDVDDLANAPGFHAGHHRLSCKEAAFDMDREHAIEILFSDLLERCLTPDPRVVDQDVEASEPALHGGELVLQASRVGHIADDRLAFAAGIPDDAYRFLRLGFENILHDHRCAACGEQTGMSPAHAAASPGNDGNAPFETRHRFSLLS